MTPASALEALAASHGIEASYVGVDGDTHRADPDVTLALLRALDVPIERADDARDLLRNQRLAEVRRRLEPVVVQRIGRGTSVVTATLPADVDPDEVWITVEEEGGETRRSRLGETVEAGAEKAVSVEGVSFRRYGVDLERIGETPIPPGYHQLLLEGAGPPETVLLVTAPDCPVAERGWGAFMPLYSVRTGGDWGIGSYSDLGQLGRWIHSLGGSMLGGLPLYPTYLEAPADPSPYRPVSRLAYNEVYVDPTTLPELEAAPQAQQLLESDDFRHRVAATHKSALVDYEEVARLRRQVLEPMARALVAGTGTGTRRQEFDAFATSHPELVAYARFRAEQEAAGHRREGGAAVVGREDGAGGGDGGGEGGVADLSPEATYFLYCQWAAATQLEEAGAALAHYADFPIGVHPDGFDPYWYPASFVRDVSGGAPPDGFFGAGQEWGFPPLHPAHIREDGYHYLIAALRRAMRHAGVLRIDHVMGLQHLYMIPQGFDAKHGAYVSYRPDELHAVVSLEAHRAGTVVVGEDLGTVPAGVRERMSADQMLRSWVFQFESSTKEPLPEVPADVLASSGTHDLPRFGAYLWGADIDENEAAGTLTARAAAKERAGRAKWRKALLRRIGCDTDAMSEADVTRAAFEACLDHLAVSAADLVLVDLEELWDERQPQNRPGTGPEADNWRHRSARTLEEAAADSRVVDLLSNLDHRRRVTP